MKKIPMKGLRFSRLEVLKQVDGPGEVWWLCRCDCGTKKAVRGMSLRSGVSKSCGCLAAELTSQRGAARVKHGFSGTREYASWKAMLSRCENPKDPAYSNYGGRGIKVCRAWHKIENFVADMGLRPPGLTLERKKNDRGYSKSNCEWATAFTQAKNRRTNRSITYKGETLIIADWARRVGIPSDTLWHRLNVGWTVEQTLTIRSRHGQRVPKG